MEIIKFERESGTEVFTLFKSQDEGKLRKMATLFEGYLTEAGYKFYDCEVSWQVDEFVLEAKIENFSGDTFEFKFGGYTDSEARSILGSTLRNNMGICGKILNRG